MNDITAIVQARFGSTRLPGKVMKDIAGHPMLWHVVNRLSYSKLIDKIIVAIPDTKENDELADYVGQLAEVGYFRGSEDDVLTRYYGAAVAYGAKTIVRVTSDCPLIDPRYSDSIIQSHLNYKADFTRDRGSPSGFDTEVFSFETLDRAYREATSKYDREHVCPYIYKTRPDLFKLNWVEANGKLNRPDLHLSVDTEQDLERIRFVYSKFGDSLFYIEDVIGLLGGKNVS